MKSHDLLFASWRPRTASDVIQSKCEGLRSREEWCKSQSEAREGVQNQVLGKKREQIPLPSAFYSIQAFNGLDGAHLR